MEQEYEVLGTMLEGRELHVCLDPEINKNKECSGGKIELRIVDLEENFDVGVYLSRQVLIDLLANSTE